MSEKNKDKEPQEGVRFSFAAGGAGMRKVSIPVDDEQMEVAVDDDGNTVYRDAFGNVKLHAHDAEDAISLAKQKGYHLETTEHEDGTVTAKVNLAKSDAVIEKLLPFTSEALQDRILDDSSVFKSMKEQTGEDPSQEVKDMQTRMAGQLSKFHKKSASGQVESQNVAEVDLADDASATVTCHACQKAGISLDSNFCPGCGHKLR